MAPGRHWPLATCGALCALWLWACSPADSRPTGPGAGAGGSVLPARIVVVSGNGQQADPGDSLDDPIQFQVQDSAGRPVADTPLALVVTIGGGSVPSATISTDSSGVAATAWTMGPNGGAQILEARVGTSITATATALTCAPDQCYPDEQLTSDLSQMTLLDLATSDGSGQTVHPTVARGHGSATGFWLGITPYPWGASAFENPSIYHSHDAGNWMLPHGAANPVALPPDNAYLSDPELVIDSNQQLWLYYRAVLSLTSQNVIKLIRSRDGIHWDSAVTVVTAPSHEVVSPAVVRGGADGAPPWQMWSVNSGSQGCSAQMTTVERRTSADGVNWSAPELVDLVQPGELVWHIDVRWIPARAEYWALYNTYPPGSTCVTDAVYLARSSDGISWTVYPSPVVRSGVIPAFSDVVYRSTLYADPHATRVTLWISGASFGSGTYNWRTATAAMSTSDLFAIVSAPAVTLQGPPRRRNLPPPEPDIGP